MEKISQLEEKKKSVERLSSTATSCNTKPQTPAFTPTPSIRPRLLKSTIFNRLKDQQGGSKRPVLKTDVEKAKLATSNTTPKSVKSVPSGSVKTPSASPSLKVFRESKVNIAGKNATTSMKSAFDFESSSDEKQPGAKNLFKSPHKEKKPNGPITPRNSGKPQPSEARARPGTLVHLIMLIARL